MGRPESSAATYSVRTPAAQNALRWATSTASLPEIRESSSSKPMNDSGSRGSMRTGIRAALTSGNRLRSALKPKEAWTTRDAEVRAASALAHQPDREPRSGDVHCSPPHTGTFSSRGNTVNVGARTPFPRFGLSEPSDAKRADRAARSEKKSLQIERADARTRTGDPFITSEVLYQLSYVGSHQDISPSSKPA